MPAPYRAYQVYILACSDGTFYTGASSNLERRLAEHERGTYPQNHTFTRRPVRLAWVETFPRPREMQDAEKQIKGWTHEKKAALIAGEIDLLKELAKKDFDGE